MDIVFSMESLFYIAAIGGIAGLWLVSLWRRDDRGRRQEQRELRTIQRRLNEKKSSSPTSKQPPDSESQSRHETDSQ